MADLLSRLNLSLPDQVTFNFSLQSSFGNRFGQDSYFDVQVTGNNTLAGWFDGYCIDTDRGIPTSGTLTAKVYSTYEQLPNQLLGAQSTLLGAPTGFGNIEYPENFDLLNWILNQSFVGETLLDQNSSSLGVVTYSDVQRAIWSLIDNQNSTTGLGPYNQARADRIISLALANGEGFIPSYEYTTIFGKQVIGKVGVILAPDTNPNDSNPVDRQFIIIGVSLAKLGDFVYHDLNTNGIQDAGEAGIAGATVNLFIDANNNNVIDTGELVGSTTTDANGKYSFETLPGDYKVQFVKPAGYDAISPGNQGTDDTKDSDPNVSTFTTGLINLSSGENDTTNDAGFYKNSSIAGVVYVDANNDGVKGTSESGIGGVTITLTGTNDLGSVTLTTTTAADGSYSFGNLRPGTYQLVESQPDGFLDGKDAVGSQGGTLGNDQVSNIILTSGTNGVNNNFGELLAASLGDRVWEDSNANGIQDNGELGLAGVTVKLLDGNGNPVIVGGTPVTATTDANGNYLSVA
ncbi:conserved repeat domain protein [Richelia sinica FACHB-800]|uniref:Conserved repeat domain protein n=1 Tax=Richelia sinica FACHB-800 TaxID=1357546 RepID=A0A975T3B7_9NOST|nr:SdrD B-like domain-containing protein [Richelia sinica]QXE21352.1 conserved repeat domain protein [Richelia sinica FACHB-800]